MKGSAWRNVYTFFHMYGKWTMRRNLNMNRKKPFGTPFSYICIGMWSVRTLYLDFKFCIVRNVGFGAFISSPLQVQENIQTWVYVSIIFDLFIFECMLVVHQNIEIFDNTLLRPQFGGRIKNCKSKTRFSLLIYKFIYCCRQKILGKSAANVVTISLNYCALSWEPFWPQRKRPKYRPSTMLLSLTDSTITDVCSETWPIPTKEMQAKSWKYALPA